jgi:hypothetical protein
VDACEEEREKKPMEMRGFSDLKRCVTNTNTKGRLCQG